MKDKGKWKAACDRRRRRIRRFAHECESDPELRNYSPIRLLRDEAMQDIVPTWQLIGLKVSRPARVRVTAMRVDTRVKE
jgi:hypothetical protein